MLRLRGAISREMAWEVMPDLFFYRDPEEVEQQAKDEAAAREAPAEVVDAPPPTDWDTPAAPPVAPSGGEWGASPAQPMAGGEWGAPVPQPMAGGENWGGAEATNWG